jgi:hypothetical protein
VNRRTTFDTFTRTRSSVVAVLAVAALGLTACGGDADGEPGTSASPATSAVAAETATPTPTPSATPEYKSASADGPAENVPVPKFDAESNEETKEGLDAFARHWYAMLNYAYESGDLEPLQNITGDGCERCDIVYKGIEEWTKKGRWSVGGDVQILQISENFAADDAGIYQLPVQIKRNSAAVYENGNKDSSEPASSPTVDLFMAKFEKSGWVAHDVGVIDTP